MPEEQDLQKAAEEEKGKTLSQLLSAAFTKSVIVNVRGVNLILEQPDKQSVLDIQLQTVNSFGDVRKFVYNPEKLKELSENKRKEIQQKLEEIRDLQTIKLIRLCCISEELDELDDDFLQMIVFQTGGDSSPLAVAAKKLTGTWDNDFIQDDPFFRRSSI